MRILIIDSHKSTKPTKQNNLHWINSKKLADYLNADFIWSYPTVNDNIKENYDVIIFVHASRYSYEDKLWLDKSPNAKIFYVTNEYNLGEPITLWKTLKEGRKYDVIANHPKEASKIVKKYVNDWHIINLNALCVDPKPVSQFPFKVTNKILYYGSFRKGRIKYFNKYFNSGKVTISSHISNFEKFQTVGVDRKRFIPRINWKKNDMASYVYSLYIEDEKTHTHYNHLANRFYEAINNGIIPIFDESCRDTIEKSGYDIGDEYIISDPSDLDEIFKNPPPFKEDWVTQATQEREDILKSFLKIISNNS